MATKHGAVGLDISSNQIRFLEMNQSQQIIKSKLVDYSSEIGFPTTEINALLSEIEHKESPVILLAKLNSEVAFSSIIPEDIDDANEFIVWKLSQLLAQPKENYSFSVDITDSEPKSAVAVAISPNEISELKSQLKTLTRPINILDAYEVTVSNLAEKLLPEIGESYVTIQIENDSLDMVSFVQSGINYREKVVLENLTECSSKIQFFLERQYTDAAAIPLVCLGSMASEVSEVLEALDNNKIIVDIDPDSDQMVEASQKGALALAYSLAFRGLTV